MFVRDAVTGAKKNICLIGFAGLIFFLLILLGLGFIKPYESRAIELNTDLLSTTNGEKDKARKALASKIRRVKVTNMFYDTPLRDALMDMATQTGVTIVPDLSVQGIVTCELNNVPLHKALDIVLASGNFLYRIMDGYILVGSLDPKSPSFLKMSDVQTITLNYIKPSDAVKGLHESFREFAMPNDQSNAVTIVAPEPILKQIVNTLCELDVSPQQIMMEARVVIMEIRDMLNLGVQWDWPIVRAGTYSNDNPDGPNWPWGIQIGYTPGREFTFSLNMTLNLLEQNNEAVILSNSQVMAQDGKEAEIKVTTEEYFEILTSGLIVESNLEVIEVGTILHIIPQITRDGHITLNMQAEVSDVVARGENNLPVVTRRQTMSTVRVQDGGTAVVAGLIDNRSAILKESVPGAGKLPVLGHLFRNADTFESIRQLLVFITPRLVSGADRPAENRSVKTKKIEYVGQEFRTKLRESLRKLNGEGRINETNITK